MHRTRCSTSGKDTSIKWEKVRAGTAVAFWAWIIAYPLFVNVFDFHILYDAVADAAFFVALPVIVAPFILYWRSSLKFVQQGKSGFFRIKNIIITTAILVTIVGTTDYVLIKNLRPPLFAIWCASYKDGGTQLYFGTGYKIYSYRRGVSPVLRGPKLDILYMPFLSIDGSFYESYKK